ncbi:BfmA/BtgA family mobilization protein [Christiangramia sp.]|uniref:BfmA/BtgA family mobilization protein n=1 Tax=Christiangramia sp. TaxID=1931228 RepID=UPI00261EDB20|nr:BfmA/BtgA family mobilization protein [Christiangramia sp.]
MDREYKKEQFETLKIKSSVAKKFRRFSRMLSKSQSVSLLMMIEFFEEHSISPMESMGPKMQTLEYLIKKRFNGVIAILKDMEKSQTKPTVAMMQSLFEESAPKKQALILEKKNAQKDPPKYQERSQQET